MKKITAFLFCLGGALLPLQAFEAEPVVPVRSLLYTVEQIEKVREVSLASPVFSVVREHYLAEANRWVNYPQAEFDALFPPDGAVFAMGTAGDPETNEGWPRNGREGLCSLQRPFEVLSPRTGKVYGIQKEGERFYDDGQGWKRPEDGKMFYFRGIWNMFVIRELHEAVGVLSHAYMLTGDPVYAERALVILDRMATMRSKRPRADGTVDWPIPPTNDYSLFGFHGNHANERTFFSALAFDLVGNAEFAKKPSPTNPALSVFANIRDNYFAMYEANNLPSRASLQNHPLSAYSSMLAQGLLFGNVDYIARGIDACYGFLDNTIDRDGEYYEVSASYQNVGRVYAARMVVLLGHYSPQRYHNSAAFPKPTDYPYDLDFGRNPAWMKSMVLSQFQVAVFGRSSQYGNSQPDRYTPERTATTRPYDPSVGEHSLVAVLFLKLFYGQSDVPAWRTIDSALYWSLPEQARNNRRTLLIGINQYGPGQWFEPQRVELEAAQIPASLLGEESFVAGQKRIAILRNAESKDRRAIFIRGGSSNPHSHDDQMGIMLYDGGMSITGVYGYNFWGTPDNRGYGTRAVAHKMVVVNEDPHSEDIFPSRTPASIEGWVAKGSARMVEMSNPTHWRRMPLQEYRRQVWMVETGKEQGYFIDVFRVAGGRTHDYVWSAPYVEPYTDEAFAIEGVNPERIDNVWILAALDPRNTRWRKAPINAEGKSWGERLEAGSGTIRNVGIPGESLTSYNWNPDPGNGYGFIWDVKAAPASNDWSATWLLHDGKTHTRMTMLNPDGQTVVTAKGPTLVAGQTQDVVIARRVAEQGKPLTSRFVTVSQIAESGNWPVREAKWLKEVAKGGVGVSLALNNGATDIFLSGTAADGVLMGGGVSLHGKRALVRFGSDGGVEKVLLSEGTQLKAGDVELHTEQSAWQAIVTAVLPNSVDVDVKLPTGTLLFGEGLQFMSSEGAALPYAANEFFTVERVEALGENRSRLSFDLQTTVAGRVKVEDVTAEGSIKSWWPNEVSAVMQPGKDAALVFQGHELVPENSAYKPVTIKGYNTKKLIGVDSPDLVQKGEFYRLMAVRSGDRMVIPVQVVLERNESFWHLRTAATVKIRLPGSSAGSKWSVSPLSGKDSVASEVVADRDGWITIAAGLQGNEGVVIKPV